MSQPITISISDVSPRRFDTSNEINLTVYGTVDGLPTKLISFVCDRVTLTEALEVWHYDKSGLNEHKVSGKLSI